MYLVLWIGASGPRWAVVTLPESYYCQIAPEKVA